MKKKFLGFVLLVNLLLLSSCFSFGDETKNPTDIEKEPSIIEIQSTVSEIYETASKGCVGIYASNNSSGSVGSGVVYKYDADTGLYYVVTNSHVIENMTTYRIFRGGANYYDATLVGNDVSNDIAVLTFSLDLFGGEVYVHDIFNYEDEIVSVGQTVLAIGCPLGLENFNYLSTGVVSRVTKSQVMTNAELNPGNSGGGLFNLSGRLIGINTEKQVYTPSVDDNGNQYEIPVEGVSYAVSLSVVKNCIEKIEAKQTTIKRPVLGITITTVNKNLINEAANEYKYYLETGLAQFVLVIDVSSGSAAEKAGIKAGDVIIRIEGEDVLISEDIKNHLYLKEVGETLSAYVYRSSSKSYLTIDILL